MSIDPGSSLGRAERPNRAEQAPGDPDERSGRVEMQLEAATMALYVAVVLLATLVVMKHGPEESDLALAQIVWGTTLGLAVAHFFAFRVSSRLVRGLSFDRRDLRLAVAQQCGAASVAAVCTLPIVLLPPGPEDDVIRGVLGVLLGVAGYASGRSGGATRGRSLALGLAVFAVGASVALFKSALSAH